MVYLFSIIFASIISFLSALAISKSKNDGKNIKRDLNTVEKSKKKVYNMTDEEKLKRLIE